MSVGSQVTLLENVVRVWVVVEVEQGAAAAVQDTGGAQVMVGGMYQYSYFCFFFMNMSYDCFLYQDIWQIPCKLSAIIFFIVFGMKGGYWTFHLSGIVILDFIYCIYLCAGATVRVVDHHLRDVAVPHRVEEATAGHHLIVLVKSCLMPTGKGHICLFANFYARDAYCLF